MSEGKSFLDEAFRQIGLIAFVLLTLLMLHSYFTLPDISSEKIVVHKLHFNAWVGIVVALLGVKVVEILKGG